MGRVSFSCVAVVFIHACVQSGMVAANLSNYHVEDHTIGPDKQQYLSDQWFTCSNASVCAEETATACDTTRAPVMYVCAYCVQHRRIV